MSGICGIINFNGAPVDPELLKKMTEAAAYRGPDGINYWVNGNVGLAHLTLHTTPESLREKQPLLNHRQDILLVADARVDNRDELVRTLTAKGYLQDKEPTDADLILAAYECWGKACPEYLIGDFAIVIWDARQRCLLAARDRVGSRPFYYRAEPGVFQWATEASQLLADPAFPIRLNEQMIAHDLAMPGYGGRHESYYAGIVKLGSAERLTADEQGVVRERYWDFAPERKIRYASDDEYAEHFKSLFRQAVRARLRSVRPVGLFMSGGLDSTSIAAVAADELARSSGGLAPGLQAIHWTFGQTPQANEWEYSREVAQRWGFGYQEVQVDPFWPLYDYPRQLPHKDEPFSSHMYSFHKGSIEALESPRPCVWMTGFEGDYVVGVFNSLYYLDLLRTLHIKLLVSEMASHCRLYHLSPWFALDKFFLSPLFLQPLKKRLRAFAGRTQVWLPMWIAPTFAQRTNLAEWVSEKADLLDVVPARLRATQWTDPAKDLRYQSIIYHPAVRMRVCYDRMTAPFGAEVWNPWSDIRLAEFILAIPEEQIARGFNHKLVLRGAMKGLLPEAVRQRRGLRTGPGLYIEEGLRKKAGVIIDMLLTNSMAGELGFLDLNNLRRTIVDFRSGKGRWTFTLWIALSLEMWLRACHSSYSLSAI